MLSKLFLTFDTRQTFIKIKEAFVKTVILNYFDLGRHIQIDKSVFEYAIDRFRYEWALDYSG